MELLPALVAQVHDALNFAQGISHATQAIHPPLDRRRRRASAGHGPRHAAGCARCTGARTGRLPARRLRRDQPARAVLGARDAIAFTDQLPLVFRGSVPVPNLALSSVGRQGIDPRQSEIIAAMYEGSRFGNVVSEGFEVRSQATQALAGEMVEANRNAITGKGFEGEARRIGRLMRERYRLAFVDVGGWDTHVGQGASSGYLANRLGELGKGLAAFAEESGDAWSSTVVIVVSEFGRTFKENGNRGTDHGHGSVFWALGGAVRGGRIAGEQAAVAPASLFQNRDYPVLNEYRAVLGGVFARLYGLSGAQLQEVFPGSTAKDIGLV